MTNESLQTLVCCMGQPVAGNPTQFMMERAFDDLGLDYRYLTFEVAPEQLVDAVRGMRAMGFRGGNFTLPHKVAVVPLLDELTQAAELMGAVNCVYVEDDRLIGENTDGKGFVQSLKTICDPQGKRIVILGAGGAARAVAVELGLSGAAHLTVVNRTSEHGQTLVELLQQRVQASAEFQPWQGDVSLPEETDIIVNATSIGLAEPDARVPLQYASLRNHMVVADVIFNPPDTLLLREAAERGCRTLDGLGMLVNQGAIAFKIWTGLEPDLAVMREALEEYLEL